MNTAEALRLGARRNEGRRPLRWTEEHLAQKIEVLEEDRQASLDTLDSLDRIEKRLVGDGCRVT